MLAMPAQGSEKWDYADRLNNIQCTLSLLFIEGINHG